MSPATAKNLKLPTINNKPVVKLPAPQLIGREEIQRPVGYVLPGLKAVSATMAVSGLTIMGFGEGSEVVAFEKAKSEAAERLALHIFCLKNGVRETSNGWAAHISEDLAIRSAVLELIERDVALTAWENGGPFYLVPQSMWPDQVSAWKESQQSLPEYFDLKIALSTTLNGVCISALLFNGRKNFVVGHASALRLEDAIISATNECMRAAHLAIRFEYLTDVLALHAGSEKLVEPGAHSLAYAYGQTMPEAVLMEEKSEEKILTLWGSHQSNFDSLDFSEFDVVLFEIGGRIVARVKSPRYRQIYWGKNRDFSKRNPSPHFVG